MTEETKDIVPELLNKVQKDFAKNFRTPEVDKLEELLSAKKATYEHAHDYALKNGYALSDALQKNISSNVLPDGKMYYNIADRILNETLGDNYTRVVQYSEDVQKILNEQIGIGVKPIRPELNQDKIDGLVNRISSEENFDDVKWILGDPIVNFAQSIVDETVKANIKFHGEVGMSPSIKRVIKGHKPCKYCRSLAGVYRYPDTPDKVYTRHENCTCLVTYDAKNGKTQNVHTKISRRKILSEAIRKKNDVEDLKSINRKSDSKEYQELLRMLGKDRMPVSLAKFQKMKYNNREEYEKLKDNAYVKDKLNSGEWSLNINPEKQSAHTESTRIPGKSYMYDSIDVQALIKNYHATGIIERNRHGERTNKEVINLGFPIGVNASDNIEVSSIKIHYSKNRTHVVPRS